MPLRALLQLLKKNYKINKYNFHHRLLFLSDTILYLIMLCTDHRLRNVSRGSSTTTTCK